MRTWAHRNASESQTAKNGERRRANGELDEMRRDCPSRTDSTAAQHPDFRRWRVMPTQLASDKAPRIAAAFDNEHDVQRRRSLCRGCERVTPARGCQECEAGSEHCASLGIAHQSRTGSYQIQSAARAGAPRALCASSVECRGRGRWWAVPTPPSPSSLPRSAASWRLPCGRRLGVGRGSAGRPVDL